ncbi:MAG: acyl-CoA thioesterase YbgC [Syntrophorhabdus sp. PtaU1.Bin002]|nr:MAG: acyl-CoA thioesterase YbgC [Syntrophorhabdus sp. PtaB.Bin006]OPY69769.1 MAG: acyl-CoA thioesterase YbgC [Syntrophorhabdus sp. PtaU1.Bin002]
MSRIRLSEQPEYKFHHTITLQPRDINYGGHLGNDALVSLLGVARVNMLRSIGISEADLGDGRTGIIMSDLVVNFRAEGFMFDELLIDTHIGELSRTGFRIFHRVTKEKTLIALAETGITTFDYASRKIAPVPVALLKALQVQTD